MFNVSLDTKQVISEMLFPANLLTGSEEIKIKVGRKNHKQSVKLG